MDEEEFLSAVVSVPALPCLPAVFDLPGGMRFVFLNSLYFVPVLSAGYLLFDVFAMKISFCQKSYRKQR